MERDYRNGKIPELTDSVIIKGFLPYQVYLISARLSDTPNYLSESEYKRILNEQIRVFDIRLELGLNYTFNSFINKLKGLSPAEIERAIQEKIQVYEDATRGMDLQVRNNVADGAKRPYGIDYGTYHYTKCLSSKELAGYYLTYEVNGEPKSNEYFDLWFMKKMCVNLKSELSTMYKRNLLDQFFYGFKPKEHEKTLVGEYLIHWESNKGFWNARSRAKNTITNEYPIIENISDSVIKNWEDKWKEFLSSRTEKNVFN